MQLLTQGLVVIAAIFAPHARAAHHPPKKHPKHHHVSHRPRHNWNYSVASVYDAAGGPIACGGDSYGPIVANKYLPCGTRLTVCYRTCTDAVVEDRGPYVAGRDFDLSRLVEERIGFPYGVDTIRWSYR